MYCIWWALGVTCRPFFICPTRPLTVGRHPDGFWAENPVYNRAVDKGLPGRISAAELTLLGPYVGSLLPDARRPGRVLVHGSRTATRVGGTGGEGGREVYETHVSPFDPYRVWGGCAHRHVPGVVRVEILLRLRSWNVRTTVFRIFFCLRLNTLSSWWRELEERLKKPSRFRVLPVHVGH